MHDVSLYLLELLENSVRADAGQIVIGVFADQATDRLRITVDDDGSGLTIDAADVLDPFYTTKKDKKTGLGLSLLKAEAEATGGHLTLGASSFGGVRVEAELILSHLDRPPVGDIASTIMVMEATNPDIIFTIDLGGDRFDPPAIRATLAEVKERLRQVCRSLDQQDIDEVEEPEYVATRPAPRQAPSNKQG